MTKPTADTLPAAKGTKTKESAFSRIATAAKRAVSPPVSSRDRSISAGIAAVFVEQSRLPMALGQPDHNTSNRTKGTSASLPVRPGSKPAAGSRIVQPAAVEAKKKATVPPPVIPKTLHVPSDVFPKNLPKPAPQTQWPKLDGRIGTTPQLALCATLLPKEKTYNANSDEPFDEPSEEEEAWSPDHREWATVLKDPIQQDRILWIVRGIIKNFANDASNDSEDVAEVVFLGPILDREYYRELLTCVVRKFDESDNLLKEHLLQAVVQLIQFAQPGYLEADDLINILGILRKRLEATHSQSIKYLYQLTLAVASILDVMAENKVNDLDRINDHEPLSAVLSGLKGTSDPYLLYQASYAYQALQYVPNNETTTQAITRGSLSVVESMVKLSSVLKLDLGGFLDGFKEFVGVAGSVFEAAKAGYEGACSLIASGQGIFESLGEVLGSGHKRPWYTVVRRAQAFVREGQLADFCRLVIEAPCRKDPFFQWGICQLLGEIATDPNWATDTRKQAVDFLSALLKDETDWCQDESVKAWALTLIERISVVPIDSFTASDASRQDHTIKDHARLLLITLKAGTDYTTLQTPPLLGSRLPLPKTSRLLKHVQDVPNVQYDLSQLKRQRISDNRQQLYVPPQAKAHLKAPDSAASPLMDYVDDFLQSDRLVLLILGDSGSGKSTFNRHLERELWKKFQPGNEKEPIPLYINLAASNRPDVDMIDEELKTHYISEPNKIKELKQHREFILICDGYDELGSMKNLYVSNRLNLGRGHWRAKMIITCRSSYLGDDYLRQFKPMSPGSTYNRGSPDLIQEAVIVPFTEDQVKNYIDQYVLDERPEQLKWAADKYKDTLDHMPSLMELVKNPFLLTLALDALPSLINDEKDLSQIKVSRLILYDQVVEVWIDIATDRFITGGLSDDERTAFEKLCRGEGFRPSVLEHLKNLARAIFEKQKGNPFVKYSPRHDRKTWKANYFGADPETTVLRLSSPLVSNGEQHSFIHLSVLDYFFAKAVYDPEESTVDHASLASHPLAQGTIASYPSILQFLSERVQQDPEGDFKNQLLDIIKNSKTDAKESQAAANAITILVKAGVRFNGADLKDIRVPGADLTGGQFDSAQLRGADLTGAALSRTWIHQADFTNARMAGVRFGELPYLKAPGMVHAGCYSPDGKTFCIGLPSGELELFDTSTWAKTHTFLGHTSFVSQLAYSPCSQYIISGSRDGTVRVWDIHSGETSQTFDDYPELVAAVAFSPSGQQFASVSRTTIWIRETKSGDTVSTFNEHTLGITDVTYSPNGLQLASSSHDGTIRLWDLQSGKPGFVFGGKLGPAICVAYSPDAEGRHVASGHSANSDHFTFDVNIWDTATGELTRRLTGHTSTISTVAFSQDGQWITSAGSDTTVRLWSAKAGIQLSVMEGHILPVSSVSFAAPDRQQIASCSLDGTVRLWDMSMSESRVGVSGQSREVTCVAYSPDGQHIISGGSDKTVWQWTVSSGESRPLMTEYSTTISCLSYSPNGKQIATAGYDTAVRLSDAQTGAIEHELWGHYGTVSGLAFSPCGQWIASSSFDTTVKLWDIQSGAPGIVLSGHDGGVTCVAFSPSGHQLATGSEDGGVRIWDSSSGETALVLLGHDDGAVRALAYAPDGLHIASCSDDKTIRLWDAVTGSLCFVFRGHSALLVSLSYSPCGKWLATGDVNGVAYLWRNRTMEPAPAPAPAPAWSCALVLRAFHGIVAGIAWNPSGGHLEFVTGCEDHSVRVWRVVDGDDGSVRANMAWGSDSGRLSAWDANIECAVDLAVVNKTLLLQRGAIEGSPVHLGQDELYVETMTV